MMFPLSIQLPAARVVIALGSLAVPLVAACLAPPTAPSAPSAPSSTTVAAKVQPPREFKQTSTELIAKHKLGWNLGNSFDAPESETAWGSPAVTRELIQAVAASGFDLVRIPVTWTLHTGPAPDFTIDPTFLARVAEVVGYVRDAGMYAIINVHHDGADGFTQVEWLTLNDGGGAITLANNQAVQARFVAVWRQIAAKFAGHGEELLFESMNEIHDGYGKPDPRYFTIINGLNQAFVELVRASGGNNAQRHLVVPGYNTNIDHTLAGFALPADPTPGRLIVSVHYYDPYLFALQAQKNTWGKASPGNDGWGQEDFVVTQFDKMKAHFIDRGVPVIIGEYGACHQQGFEDYRRYYMEYVTKAAVDRGMLPIYWDNGAEGSGGEKFGLFSRSNYTPLHPKLLEAMMRAAKSSYKLSDIAPPAP
jgi:endoglucanase